MKELKIACPRCHWEPDGGAYWQCSCGHVWDTFQTGAKCPSCGKQWKYTECPDFAGGCGGSSPHIDWYHDSDERIEEEISQILHPQLEPMQNKKP